MNDLELSQLRSMVAKVSKGPEGDRGARLAVYAVTTGNALGFDEDDLATVRLLAEAFAGGVGEFNVFVKEAWDGTGPMGWAGSRIPLFARVLAVADWFDSETMIGGKADREVLLALEKLGGFRFDPAVVLAFKAVQPLIQPLGMNVG